MSLWSEQTALFGGQFDPPHEGHRDAITGLLENPGVARVWVIPSGRAPHRSNFATANQRLEMTRILLKDLPRVDVSSLEVEWSISRPNEPSYSWNTIQELRPRFGANLAWVVGSDQLVALSTWWRFPEILGLCHWIVLNRKNPVGGVPLSHSQPARELETQALGVLADWEASGLVRKTTDPRAVASQSRGTWKVGAASAPQGMPRYLTWLETPASGWSSSAIRSALAKTGSPPEGALPNDIVDYLKRHQLYGIDAPSKNRGSRA